MVQRNKWLFNAILLVWGASLAIYFINQYYPLNESELNTILSGRLYMPSRWKNISRCIQEFGMGRLPQISRSSDHSLGLFLLMGYWGNKLGIQEGYEILAFFQINLSGLLFVIFPIEIYYTFKSKIAAFAAPLLLHLILGKMLYIDKTDVHWGAVWVIAITLPLLYIFLKISIKKICYSIFAILCFLISFGNIFRSHSSMLPAILLMAIMIYKLKICWPKQFITFMIGIFILLFSYNLLGHTIPEVLCKLDGQPSASTSDTLWHSMYIGLGFEENKYGIYYSDDCAKEHVEQLYPEIEYHSKEYYAACKELYFTLLKNDPWFCIQGYIKKFFLSLYEISFYLKDMVVLFAIAIFITLGNFILYKELFIKIYKQYAFLIISCILGIFIGMAQAILAQPDYRYLFPSSASVCLNIIFIFLINIKIWTVQLGLRLHNEK